MLHPGLCPIQDRPYIALDRLVSALGYFGVLIYQIVILVTARLQDRLPKYIVAHTVACSLGFISQFMLYDEYIPPSNLIVKSARYVMTLSPLVVALVTLWYRLFRVVSKLRKKIFLGITILSISAFGLTAVAPWWPTGDYLVAWSSLVIVISVLLAASVVYVDVAYSHIHRKIYVPLTIFCSLALIGCHGAIIYYSGTIRTTVLLWSLVFGIHKLLALITMSVLAYRRRISATDQLLN